jgi:hypothetical protein
MKRWAREDIEIFRVDAVWRNGMSNGRGKMSNIEKELGWEEQVALMKANRPRLLEAMELLRETYPLYAEQYRKYFEALTAQGFTPEQALELIKAHGWLPK